jgi:hypothetical protein
MLKKIIPILLACASVSTAADAATILANQKKTAFPCASGQEAAERLRLFLKIPARKESVSVEIGFFFIQNIPQSFHQQQYVKPEPQTLFIMDSRITVMRD